MIQVANGHPEKEGEVLHSAGLVAAGWAVDLSFCFSAFEKPVGRDRHGQTQLQNAPGELENLPDQGRKGREDDEDDVDAEDDDRSRDVEPSE